ncbi:YkvI family membrane protein [Halothermothrix orenii]|uniref:Uncharacterized membrane protein n=1 Tax=Halothermothrix orenii (strain H 168 / OCM 544 / DSM 9562) TaxID=373903 RepID=B8D244_HALOH|nr:membrane protein [Halothermothrix orenii]ACL69271.1 uncharacterized membrane protein [Halothermothrix orenii H 168]
MVGAGFASGQEVLQFFGFYGLGGFGGLVLTIMLFVIYGYIILSLGREYRARSHLEVIRYAGGRWLSKVIDGVITFFLFGALTAMVAGSGAIFLEQFGIPSLWGNIAMIGASILTTLFGIGGVISAISFVVPLLLTGVFLATIASVIGALPVNIADLHQALPGRAPVPHWALSSVVYASYNIVLAVAVLAPLGSRVNDKRKLKYGAIFGGVGLGLGAMFILLAILLNIPRVLEYEIPMIYVAGNFAPWFQLVYSGILLAEIYTTAVGNLYGFVARLTDPEGKKYRTYIILTGVAAFITSQLGFSNLVRYLYPAVGYAGLLLLGGLTLGMYRRVRNR